MFEAQKVVIVALAAVLLFRKNTKPPVNPLGSLLTLLLARPELIIAVPAVLVLRKAIGPVLKALRVAGPAVLEFVNSSAGKVTLNVGLFGRLAMMPVPLIVNGLTSGPVGTVSKVKFGAVNDRFWTAVGTENVIEVGVSALKVAVPVGTLAELQLLPVLKSVLVAPTHVAS